MAAKTPAANHPDLYLGSTWQPVGAPLSDPNIPMPVLDNAGERETRRAQGYGYSDYT
jgi:hypothetical protein